MVGAPKQRASKAKENSSQNTSNSSKQAASGERSSPSSIPRMDGNRDPAEARNTLLISNKRIELDAVAWAVNKQVSQLPLRLLDVALNAWPHTYHPPSSFLQSYHRLFPQVWY
jgi:ABC-type oligopeptide transport system substrate-binding subunit